MKLINIGFSSLVAAGRVLAIMDPDSAPIKRVVQEAKERGMLIDASYGRKTKAVAFRCNSLFSFALSLKNTFHFYI